MKLRAKLNLIRVLLAAFVLSFFMASCTASKNTSCQFSAYGKKKIKYYNATYHNR